MIHEVGFAIIEKMPDCPLQADFRMFESKNTDKIIEYQVNCDTRTITI
jgi:hypothetical protein